MGMIDVHLSDNQKSILQRRRAKIATSFFILFGFVILFSFLVQNTLSNFIKKGIVIEDILVLKNILLGTFVFILAYLAWILFRLIFPTYESYLDIITDLLSSRSNSIMGKVSKENALSHKEDILLQYRDLNFAVDNTVLFATVEEDNAIAYISKKLVAFLGLDFPPLGRKLQDIMTDVEEEKQKVQKVLSNPKDEFVKREIKITDPFGKNLWLDLSIVGIDSDLNVKRKLIVFNDVTRNREIQKEIERINRLRFEEEVQTQKKISSKIVEAQEQERKRIAKDIHDGIGQMLTALRFSMDALDLSDIKKSKKDVASLKEVFGQLIQDVRAVTFSLTPPELADYGIASALRKMTQELSRLTGQTILFENKTDFNERFDSAKETNIYRIVQEAVTNALKYAESEYILISLSHDAMHLNILIEDDGNGFDLSKLEQSEQGLGYGLLFMQERVKYISSNLHIDAEIGRGTKVFLEVVL